MNKFTINAIGTQTAIAEKIKSYRADYVLAVKENQKNSREIFRRNYKPLKF